MPEVPENMQQNIAHLEQEAQGRRTLSPSNSVHHHGHNNQSLNSVASYNARQVPAPESPNFSPFPRLQYHPPNVPPTDEQKESTLEAAREQVLASNDPENQLTWAQDALQYVEVAVANEQRVSPRQGIRPHTPTVERRLKEDAMNIVRFLAEQQHPRAQFMLGMWLEFGKFGYRLDKKEAFHCYTRAAEKGYARAEYRIGMQFENSGEPSKAIKYYQKGVDAGDSASLYRLGMMTLLGQHGQSQSYERGLQLIYASAQSADENAPQGAYVYGLLQAKQLDQVRIPSQYLPRDLGGARINVEKAAYLGFMKAQVKMGSAYELCDLGCEFNPALSLHYNALAARQGDAEAEMAISKWFLSGSEGVFPKNEEMAFTYAERAAVSGLETAEFAMGYFHEVGIYIPVDLNVAREWYEKAASKGNTDAKGRIQGLMHSQTLSRKDHERVALARIRQQHGSQRQGSVPLRPVPNMSQQSIHMPDPGSMMPQGSSYLPIGGGYGPPQQMPDPNGFRPNSAFGINPNVRPGSAATVGGMPPNGRPMVSPPVQRPYTSMTDARPTPRPGPGPGYGRPPPRQGPPPGQMGYPPGSGPPPQPMHRLPQAGYSPQGGDFGFAAPPDPHGADRPVRYGMDHAPRPRPHPNGHGSGAPPRTSSRPDAGGRPAPPRESVRPAAPAQAKPPPKGPSTFEEMGVPMKKNSDCVCSRPFPSPRPCDQEANHDAGCDVIPSCLYWTIAITGRLVRSTRPQWHSIAYGVLNLSSFVPKILFHS